MNKTKDLFNLASFGHAVKAARIDGKMTRDQLAEKLGITSRYLAQIENRGQHPSFQVFYELATMFNISVDEYFYPDTGTAKSTKRRTLDALLDRLDDKALHVVQGAVAAYLETSK